MLRLVRAANLVLTQWAHVQYRIADPTFRGLHRPFAAAAGAAVRLPHDASLDQCTCLRQEIS